MAEGRGIIGRLVIKITGDSSEAKAALRDVETQTDASAKKIGRSTQEITGSVNKATKSFSDLRAMIGRVIGIVGLLAAAVTAAFKVGQTIGKRIFGDEEELARIEKKFDDLAKTAQKAILDVGRQVDPMRDKIKQATAAIDGQIAALQAEQDQLADSAGDRDQYAKYQELVVQLLRARGDAVKRVREEEERLQQQEARRAELQRIQELESFAIRALEEMRRIEESFLSERERMELQIERRVQELRQQGFNELAEDYRRLGDEQIRRVREQESERARLQQEAAEREEARAREQHEREMQRIREQQAAVDRANRERFGNIGVQGSSAQTEEILRSIDRNTRGGSRPR